jgi:hypothetical protein
MCEVGSLQSDWPVLPKVRPSKRAFSPRIIVPGPREMGISPGENPLFPLLPRLRQPPARFSQPWPKLPASRPNLRWPPAKLRPSPAKLAGTRPEGLFPIRKTGSWRREEAMQLPGAVPFPSANWERGIRYLTPNNFLNSAAISPSRRHVASSTLLLSERRDRRRSISNRRGNKYPPAMLRAGSMMSSKSASILAQRSSERKIRF